MSETVALALVTGVTGLGGALIGVFAMMRVERRRERRERSALMSAIRMDMIRWMDACQGMADEWNLRAHAGQSITWAQFAGPASVHFPPGLTAILFRVYQAREQSEAAYAEFATGISEDEAPRAFSARFSLRRWALMARAALEEWDRYLGRSRWSRLRVRVRPDPLERTGFEFELAALDGWIARTRELLMGTYDYEVSRLLDLVPSNHTTQAYQEMKNEFLEVQRRETRPADAEMEPSGDVDQ